MDELTVTTDYGWPDGEFMEAKCPRCEATSKVSIVRWSEVCPFECDGCMRDLEIYPDGSVVHVRFMTMAEQDHLIQESLARKEGVSFAEAAKWMPERGPALPTAREQLAFQMQTGRPMIEFDPNPSHDG